MLESAYRYYRPVQLEKANLLTLGRRLFSTPTRISAYKIVHCSHINDYSWCENIKSES